MANLTDLGTAAWRLRKWVEKSKEERKMPAISALKNIDRYLKENNVEVFDPVGSQFDAGLAVTVVNNESDSTDEDELLIIDTIKPIVMVDGIVAQYGQVVLGDTMPDTDDHPSDEAENHAEYESKAVSTLEDENQQKREITKADWIFGTVCAIIVLGLCILIDLI